MLVSEASLRARPEILQGWRALAQSEPVALRGLFGQLAAALGHDAFGRLGNIPHPTLVLTGDDDPIVSPTNSRILASAIPNATLNVLAGARHDFTTDHPEATARALLDFFGASVA
jgi:pimeloyl-ACP methyl ester carboxylesterase